MDKRLEENLRVKNAIANAFLSLLERRTAEEISISAITAQAHVSRMAFYRNFTTKLDIIRFYYEDVIFREMERILAKEHGEELDFWSIEYGIAFFTVMKNHRDTILMLDKMNYSGLLLQAFNETNINLAGDMPANSIERYHIYYAAGASFNGMLEWLRGGCRESVEDIVESIYSFMNVSYND